MLMLKKTLQKIRRDDREVDPSEQLNCQLRNQKKAPWMWISMVLRRMWVARALEAQLVVAGCGEVRHRTSPIRITRSKTASTASSSRSVNPTKIDMHMGKPLTPSIITEQMHHIADCPHSEKYLKARASRGMKWITCLAGGSRWERLGGAGEQRQKAPEAASQNSSEVRRDPPTCRKCSRGMVLRENRVDNEKFYGCLGFSVKDKTGKQVCKATLPCWQTPPFA